MITSVIFRTVGLVAMGLFPLGSVTVAQTNELERLSTEIQERQDSWIACLKQEAIRLGQNNQENSETVVRAAESRCLDTQGENLSALRTLLSTHAYKRALANRRLVPSTVIDREVDSYFESFNERSKSRAVADLLEARSSH